MSRRKQLTDPQLNIYDGLDQSMRFTKEFSIIDFGEQLGFIHYLIWTDDSDSYAIKEVLEGELIA